MKLSEKVAYRLKRVYIGMALGFALWLLLISFLVFFNAIKTHTPIASIDLTLSPMETSMARQK